MPREYDELRIRIWGVGHRQYFVLANGLACAGALIDLEGAPDFRADLNDLLREQFRQVPRAEELHAFQLLDKYLFSDGAWSISPATLNRLVYSEWESNPSAVWAYNPQPRHDMPVAEMAEGLAEQQLARMFQPLMLERVDDLGLKAKPGSTMSLTDLFDWTQRSLYGDLHDPKLQTIGEVHRAIQQWYARKLVQIWLAPDPGTPYDGQSMARAELVDLQGTLAGALGRSGLDEVTRAHLASLQDVVTRALTARQMVPAP